MPDAIKCRSHPSRGVAPTSHLATQIEQSTISPLINSARCDSLGNQRGETKTCRALGYSGKAKGLVSDKGDLSIMNIRNGGCVVRVATSPIPSEAAISPIHVDRHLIRLEKLRNVGVGSATLLRHRGPHLARAVFGVKRVRSWVRTVGSTDARSAAVVHLTHAVGCERLVRIRVHVRSAATVAVGGRRHM